MEVIRRVEKQDGDFDCHIKMRSLLAPLQISIMTKLVVHREGHQSSICKQADPVRFQICED